MLTYHSAIDNQHMLDKNIIQNNNKIDYELYIELREKSQ
jgi:hypothetical protein